MTYEKDRFNLSFSTAKIHILFKPAIIFSNKFLFLYPFLSTKWKIKDEIPVFWYEVKIGKKKTNENDRFRWSLYQI